ncbi:MAG: double zinc ribbon domain-containing protein [Candidatus Kariarchaeaceae archaeon]|jgi:predicted amidophosphoribosyltransferase
MRCNNCGADNPPEARFCFECGKEIFSKSSISPSKEESVLHCSKCGVSNPKNMSFCFECGTPLAREQEVESNICPTCGIPVDSTAYNCPNCGQSVGIKPAIGAKKSVIISSDETKQICPSCGQKTSGDYCKSCGFHLKDRDNPVEWWYCARDSAIMQEIDPSTQFLISKENTDKAIASALTEKNFPEHFRSSIKSLTNQVFAHDSKSKFCSVTQVKCPVCGQTSYASINQKPTGLQTSGLAAHYLSGSTILRNGIFYLKNYKGFLVITLVAILLDILLDLMGFGVTSFLDPLSSTFTPGIGESLPIELLLANLIMSFLITSFIQSWYLASFHQLRKNASQSFNLIESLQEGIKKLPIVIALQVLILFISLSSIIVVTVLGAGSILSFTDFENTTSILTIMLLMLVLLLLSAVISFVISTLLTYMLPAYFFEPDAGVTNSIKRSYRFSRRYFWTTVGMIIVFSFLSGISSYLAIPSILFLNIPIIPMLLTSIVSRLVEAFRTIAFAWAYDEFKEEIRI